MANKEEKFRPLPGHLANMERHIGTVEAILQAGEMKVLTDPDMTMGDLALLHKRQVEASQTYTWLKNLEAKFAQMAGVRPIIGLNGNAIH